jgi:16S rRNA (guanine966-N2)-methyltransferase
MRIVGGQWKRRLLAPLPPGSAIRPTSDRMRESVFNILEHRFAMPAPDVRVLDLCSGSGALGLEALSRGAAIATFVDSSPEALALARNNADALAAAPQCHFLGQDARDLSRLPHGPYGLIFLDAPYRAGLDEDILEALAACPALAAGALIVHEQEKNYKILNKSIEIIFCKVYNKSQITFGLVRGGHT